LLEGVNPAPTTELVEAVNIPVIAAGGVTTVADVKAIKQTNAAGAVIGSALYTGRISLSEAIRAGL
jgi:phosphoribosylformimino-5-aminoimidazole carboxamide ribotide isomerase